MTLNTHFLFYKTLQNTFEKKKRFNKESSHYSRKIITPDLVSITQNTSTTWMFTNIHVTPDLVSITQNTSTTWLFTSIHV